MPRHFAAALLVLAVAPAADALPTADEVKANVRRAVGFEAFRKLEHGLDLEGKAEFFGLPGTFAMRLHPDGRYARTIEASGTQAVGFDGTTRWGRNFADPALDLHFDEADRDRFLFGVLCHRWLPVEGGFAVAVDERTSRADQLDLVLSHPDAGVAARLAVDPTTWLPKSLRIPGQRLGRFFDFADYRTVAGVTLPVRIGQDRTEGGQWLAAERAGAAAAGGPDRFARPVVRRLATFDPTVPAKLESRKGPGGMVLVRATVDGKAAPWFVLDTGNGARTAIAVGLADRLGFSAAGSVILSAVGGETRTRFRSARRLTLGPATLPNPIFADIPDSVSWAMSESAGVMMGGFLGQDVLFQMVVELDPTNGTAAVHDPTRYRLPAGGAWEPVRFNGRAPCLRATFEGKHAGWYSFDSGFEAPLLFNLPAIARGKMLDGRETHPHTIYGGAGEEPVREGAGGEFRAFGRTTRTAKTLYAVVPAGSHNCPYTLGAFGPSALGPGTLVLDYPNSRIGFVPRP